METATFKNRYAKYRAKNKDKLKNKLKKWKGKNHTRIKDYNAWYREKKNGNTVETWLERAAKLGYNNASKGCASLHRKNHEIRNNITGKLCSACKEWNPLEKFNLNSKAWDKKRTTCKNCMAKKRKEKCAERTAYMKKYEKKRKRTDPEFALCKRLRSRINSALKGQKSNSTMELLGCDIKTAKKYIEDQFEDWMSWSNTKEWHIDHVVPFNAFKGELDKQTQRIVCWYKNFKPISARANLEKGGKWSELDKQNLIFQYKEEHANNI
ncbi:MAG: hypothetical protein CL967_05630 [Euryarchaeota archaeon]|nr:hypothetical protein [Euryarchaeota archaeon]